MDTKDITSVNTSDPITIPEIVDVLKNNVKQETSLYRIYKKLASEHGKCWSKDISDRLYYPKAAINVKAVIVGDPGSGKSVSAASTCEGVSFWNSLREYDDTRHMLKYFTIDPAHVAIMIKKEIKNMFQNANVMYNCYLGDDIGSAWNSRLWAKLFNQILNAYIGTDRTFRTFKCVTLASDKELDAQARNKFTDYCEMDGPQIFEQNVVFGKLFKIRGKARINKIFYPRLRGKDWETGQKIIYQKIAFLPPSTKLKLIYDEVRDYKAKEFHSKQFKELDDMESLIMQGGNPNNPNSKNKKDKDFKEQMVIEAIKKSPFNGSKKKGARGKYYQEIAESIGCSKGYVSDLYLSLKWKEPQDKPESP
jgi:hypothetical protein